jgi:Fe2+ transport system protein FeoA
MLVGLPSKIIRMITQLCCAKDGNVCEIVSVKGINRCRFSELGFNKGVKVEVISHLDDSLRLNIRNYCIALRKSEAEDITVRIIESK